MTTVTKYARTITQTTGGKFATFENLNNIKNNTTGSYSESHTRIKGKSGSPNRPSTLSLTNFGFNIPSGALVKKIIVEYRHSKLKYNNKVCNIGAPTISLIGVSGSGKGVAPTTSLVTSTRTFNINQNISSKINSSSFGVKINYPTNTNAYEGYMRISYIRIKVEYVDSAYTLSLKKVSGGYNEEDYTVQAVISNKYMTDNNPNVIITSPTGFTFKSSTGKGKVTKNNARTFTWNPGLNKKTGTSTINLVFSTSVVYPSGVETYTGTFSAVEQYKKTTSNLTATITERPATGTETVTEDTQTVENYETANTDNAVLLVNANEEFVFSVEFTDEENTFYNNLLDSDPTALQYISLDVFKLVNGTYNGLNHYNIYNDLEYDETVPDEIVDAEGERWFLNKTLSINAVGTYKITLGYCDELNPSSNQEFRQFTVYVRPTLSELENPYYTIIKLTEEETNRMGHNFPYVAQSFMKEITSETYVRDWYKNFRIGIFNNPIAENITVTTSTDSETGETIETITDSTDYDLLSNVEIFENAEYWSNPLTAVNVFESLECHFPYNENYPVYIIIGGDWADAEEYGSGWECADIQFTEPCIVEESYYNGKTSTGIYPIPIKNLTLNDGSNAELTIPENNESSSIIFYDWMMEDDLSDDVAIQGIGVIADIEQTDDLTLYATLKSPKGLTGARSLIVNDVDFNSEEETLSIGGIGDLWGFSRSDFKDIKDWELLLNVSNILSDSSSNINFGDVQLVLFLNDIVKQDIIIEVEDEDLAMMGVSIESITIPEGLETDTAFLSIDGTDTNDAYRQNIREKTIKLKLRVGGCDLDVTTAYLRQLTKLLVNERDEYNRPIPKRITFSHYPDVYFEYIIEDALKIESQLTSYKVEADLTIPSGTSFSLDEIVTGNIGYVQGLAAVSPVIQVTPTDSTIEVLETISGKKFNMGYSGNWYDKIVEINCDDMKAYLKTTEDDVNPVDISEYVDINSSWFHLKGEYNFQTTNCVLRLVQYNERW